MTNRDVCTWGAWYWGQRAHRPGETGRGSALSDGRLDTAPSTSWRLKREEVQLWGKWLSQPFFNLKYFRSEYALWQTFFRLWHPFLTNWGYGCTTLTILILTRLITEREKIVADDFTHASYKMLMNNYYIDWYYGGKMMTFKESWNNSYLENNFSKVSREILFNQVWVLALTFENHWPRGYRSGRLASQRPNIFRLLD